MEETGPNSYLVHCIVSKTIYDFIQELQEIDTCLTQRDWRSIDLPDTPCVLSLLSRLYNLEVVTRHTDDHQKWKHVHDKLHNLVHPPRTTLVLSPREEQQIKAQRAQQYFRLQRETRLINHTQFCPAYYNSTRPTPSTRDNSPDDTRIIINTKTTTKTTQTATTTTDNQPKSRRRLQPSLFAPRRKLRP